MDQHHGEGGDLIGGAETRPARAAEKRHVSQEEEVVEIIGVIVAGIIIGLLGKFVAPGNRDNIPIWLTILCGIGGVIIGWYIYTAFGGHGSPRFARGRRVIAIVGSEVPGMNA